MFTVTFRDNSDHTIMISLLLRIHEYLIFHAWTLKGPTAAELAPHCSAMYDVWAIASIRTPVMAMIKCAQTSSVLDPELGYVDLPAVNGHRHTCWWIAVIIIRSLKHTWYLIDVNGFSSSVRIFPSLTSDWKLRAHINIVGKRWFSRSHSRRFHNDVGGFWSQHISGYAEHTVLNHA
jgi:hypothetical protein